MDTENQKGKQELEENLYSSLNIGSFLEAKRRNQQTETSFSREKKYQEVNVEPRREARKREELEETQKIEPRHAVKELEETISEEKTQKIEVPKREVPKIEVPKREISEKEETYVEKVAKELEKGLKKEEDKKIEKKEEKLVSEENLIEEKPEIIDQEVLEAKKQIWESLNENKSKKKKEKKEKIKKEPKKEREKKPKKNRKLLFGVIVCALMDLLALIGLFLTYGPISYFRNMLVTSAMTTMSHKYLARIFYDDATIQKVLASNVVYESGENTDASKIDFEDAKDTGEYESIYEEQILKREEGTLYKVIDIKGSGYAGYLVAVYDASRVELISATNKGYGGALLTEMSKKHGAKVAINASGFANGIAVGKGSIPVGTVIQDGKIVTVGGVTGYGGGLAGFNKDHVLVLTRDNPGAAIDNGMVDAVEFGPFLIVNGKAAEIEGNGGWGIAPRTVLAQRKDGIVLFLIIDGRNAKHSLGVDMKELIKILTRYKAYNAVNLDGGGSSTLVVEGNLVNIPCGSTCGQRYLPNAWIVR